MFRYLVLLAVLLSPFSLLPAQTCDCPENFEFLRQKVAANYSGYRDKVTAATKPQLDELTYRLTNQAENASDTACFRLMLQWTAFFRDGHLQLSSNQQGPTLSPEAIRARFANTETIALTEAEARAWLDANRATLDPIEGIWTMRSGNYRVVIVRRPTAQRDYAAVILKADSVWWMPGQIKMELKRTAEPGRLDTRFYMRDHSLNPLPAAYTDRVLEVKGLSMWTKDYPAASNGADPLGSYTSAFPLPGGTPGADFSLRWLDDEQTVVLRIPTFNHELRHRLDTMLENHQARLERTPYWIIDVRGNGGGSDISYSKVTPYLYTHPIPYHAMSIYATPDNIDKFRKLTTDPNLPESVHRDYKKLVKKLERHQGDFYRGKNGVRKMKKSLPYPQRVAVLTDRGCGSSCEQFVLYAKGSRKVTVIGERTAGVLDYGNLHSLPLPCNGWQLNYPTSRSNRVDEGVGIDNQGIQPDVVPGEGVADWVEYARTLLKK